MVQMAVGWQVYNLTNSKLALGLMGLVQIVPVLGLALWAGHLADRVDRRRILVVTQCLHTACSLALLGIALFDGKAVWSIFAVLFVVGCVRGVQGPSMQAIMPSLVPIQHFANAVGWRALLFEAASVTGPLIGGALLAGEHGLAGVYLVGALLSGSAVILIRGLPAAPPAGDMGKDKDPLGGLRFVWRRKAILGALTLDLFAVLFGGVTALMPVFAKDILRVGPRGLGLLCAAPEMGAILVSFALLHRRPIARAGRTLLVVVAVFGACMAGFGLSTWFPLSLLLLIVGGMADGVSVIIRHTIVQTMTPDAMRGRVSAVNGIFFNASNELGELESGVAASLLGTVPSVVAGGVATLVVVGLAARHFPEMRRLGRLDGLEASN